MNQQLYRLLSAVLAARRDEFDHPDEQLATMFALGIVGGLTREAITTGQKLFSTNASPNLLQKEITRTLVGYLGVKVN